MEEQYELWKRQTIERRASVYSGSAQTLGGDTLAEAQERLSYEDFKNEIMQGNDGGELLNYVNSHVIFQAGVDFESRPMLVFCACNLPNPQVVDYDRLLNLIIFRLDEFVENDYTVVLFTSGAKFNPGWNWLSKAYKRLDRKYRKNVKSVYVVHPSLWSKLLFQIVGRIVSPKFFAKVTWVDTLSRLATFVPLSQINIPQPVYDYNMTVEQAIKMPTPEHEILATQAFGVPLDVLMQDGTGILPRPVRECISFIRYNGLATEGLFRRSPPSTALRAAKDMYNRGYNVDLSLSGVHVAAVLLKLFFRELPSPVFGSASYETILALPSVQPETDSAADREDSEVNEVAKQMDTVRARYVEEVLLPSLTFEYRQLLCFTCALLAVIARNKEINRMSAYNLAVVWSPNLARSANPMVDVAMCSAGPQSSTVGSVIQIFIQFFDSVFNSEIEMVLGKERKAQCTDLASEMLNVVDNMNRMANLAHVNHTTVFEYLQTGDASSPPALPQRHGDVPPPVPPKVPPRLPARLEAEAPPVPPKGEPAVGVAAPEDIVAAALPTAASEAETEAPAATDGAREAAISPAPEHESPKEEEAKPAEPKVEEKKLEEPKVEEEAVSEPVVEDVAESKKAVEEDEPTEVFEEATAEIVSPEAAAAPEAAPVEALADDLAETTVNEADKEDDKPMDDASEEPAEEKDAENAASNTKATPAGGKKKKVIKKKRGNQGSSNSSN